MPLRLSVLAISLLLACGPAGVEDAGMDVGGTDTPRSDAPAPLLDASAAVGDWQDWEPEGPGPFNVGYRQFEHTYTPPGFTAPRTILINLWYPTLATDGAHPRYLGAFSDPSSIVDAPLAASIYEGGRYPVHVYSHGDRGFGGTSAFLMRRFASHGWVAVAPDHTGNTFNGNLTPRPTWMYYVRSTDVSAALDAVEALGAEDPLAGLLDVDRVIASGHSYGTHTMWASAGATFDVAGFGAACIADGTCTAAERDAFAAGVGDPRIVGIIPMAGAINRTYFGPTGHTSVTVPILSLSGTADPVGADVQFSSTSPLPMIWVDVEGACHQFFALGCDGDAPLDEDLIIGGFALAFARLHLLSDATTPVTEILDGTRVLSPRVHFMAR